MSTLGLNATLYSRVRDYAEVLDHVLVRLKSGGSIADDARTRRLASLLHGLGTAPERNLEVQLLRAVLQSAGTPQAKWHQLSEELAAGQATPQLIAQLEILANTLENERAGMLAKMRGG